MSDGTQPAAAEPDRTDATQDALDGAMHSVWLHGHWRRLTRPMTTEQKEAAWAAVKRHSATSDPDFEPLDDADWAWWRN